MDIRLMYGYTFKFNFLLIINYAAMNIHAHVFFVDFHFHFFLVDI